jgi:hypothetical protein
MTKIVDLSLKILNSDNWSIFSHFLKYQMDCPLNPMGVEHLVFTGRVSIIICRQFKPSQGESVKLNNTNGSGHKSLWRLGRGVREGDNGQRPLGDLNGNVMVHSFTIHTTTLVLIVKPLYRGEGKISVSFDNNRLLPLNILEGLFGLDNGDFELLCRERFLPDLNNCSFVFVFVKGSLKTCQPANLSSDCSLAPGFLSGGFLACLVVVLFDAVSVFRFGGGV